MAYQRSPWVTFLRKYGPVSDNDAMYDELVLNAARRNGVEPLRLDSGGLLEVLVANFRSEHPRSVILTGTAGDGKTWLCREVWDELGGDRSVWHGDATVRTLPLPAGGRLVVLKDLSEARIEDADRYLGGMADALLTDLHPTAYLVAANDGQLRAAWARIAAAQPDHAPAARIVEDLLLASRLRADHPRLVLYNLSRQDSARRMAQLLDALAAHPGWSRCDGCPGQREGDARCPIWENKSRINDPLLRARLTDLLTLCDQSGYHLPLRQLLLLASNMVLGHPDGKDDMLRCQEVEEVLRKDTAHRASLYRNAFGENLPEHRRDRTEVFEVLRRFGIGEETSNRIDNLLVYGNDDPELRPHFDALFAGDARYGADNHFARSLKLYLEGGEAAGVAPFPEVAVAQRQRLFFTLPPERAEAMGLWELTVFRHAGEYLSRILRPLQTRPDDEADERLVRRLVRGLNRVFTGRLTDDDDALWLASSGSHSQSPVCRIYEHHVAVDGGFGRGVSVRWRDGTPAVVVSFAQGVEAALPLHLIRFEFLSRVADGALPSNFSRECYEDILSFKSRLLQTLRSAQGRGARAFKLELLRMEAGRLSKDAISLDLEVAR
jgi:hypothetical protein